LFEFFQALNPVLQAFIATTFTWAMTALGAAAVFVFKEPSRRMLDGMLGFAAGVMIAASFWSLLVPAIEASRGGGVPEWVPATVGFLIGAFFLWGIDKVLPHLHPRFPPSKAEGISSHLQKSVLMFLAMTLHNIPEGLAIGVAFGAVAAGLPTASLAVAIALAIGIGIQNIPEGTAISVPLRRAGLTRLKSFGYGQASALVEPVAAVAGALAVVVLTPLLPYALAFAAGAMIFVVVEDVIPESQAGGFTDFATIGTIIGFALMTVLDVALG